AAGSRVIGRVLDAESRSPITGALVTLMPPRNSTALPGANGPLQVVTDASGQFVFDAISPGPYGIAVQKLGFAPLSDSANAPTLDVPAGRPLAGLELTLT